MAADARDDLEVLFRICSEVHGVVRSAMTSPHRADIVAMGADGSPTEQLDRIAESQIVAALESEGVDWNLVSEEIGTIDRGGDRTLVVDPIDGSHNALRGLPFATTSLALGRTNLGGIDLGVVHDLSSGANFWATRGGGAFKDGRRLRTRAWDPKHELFFVNLGRHSTPRAVALAGKGRRIRSLGCASFELVMVAQGGADAYFFENDTANRNLRVTDIAAAGLILREAGGAVSTGDLGSLDGIPLELAQHTSVLGVGDRAFTDAARRDGYL